MVAVVREERARNRVAKGFVVIVDYDGILFGI